MKEENSRTSWRRRRRGHARWRRPDRRTPARLVRSIRSALRGSTGRRVHEMFSRLFGSFENTNLCRCLISRERTLSPAKVKMSALASVARSKNSAGVFDFIYLILFYARLVSNLLAISELSPQRSSVSCEHQFYHVKLFITFPDNSANVPSAVSGPRSRPCDCPMQH